MREINQLGIDLIKGYEGIEDGDPTTVNLDPYIDPVQIYTIGWGHAIVYNKRFLKSTIKGDKELAYSLYPGGITIQQAETLLKGDLQSTSLQVSNLIKVPVTDNQFAALVSFAFNLGIGNLQSSTLLKKLNAGDFEGASNEFPKWNKANKVIMAGLTRRRIAEQTLFNKV